MVLELGKTLKALPYARLPGGIFSIVCVVLIVVVIAVTTLAGLSHDKWVIAGSIVLVVAMGWTLLRRMIEFVEKHPAEAILDPLNYYQLLASKGNQVITVTTMEENPKQLPGPELAVQPEEEPEEPEEGEGDGA